MKRCPLSSIAVASAGWMADGLQSPYAAAVHTCGADVNAREGARRRSRTGVNHAARGDEGKPMTPAPPFSLVAGQAALPNAGCGQSKFSPPYLLRIWPDVRPNEACLTGKPLSVRESRTTICICTCGLWSALAGAGFHHYSFVTSKRTLLPPALKSLTFMASVRGWIRQRGADQCSSGGSQHIEIEL